MSCSKIFSGKLPELTYEVIKFLRDDFSSLHSCILVNRLWCRLATPLLWENPFSFRNRNYNYFEIYSQYLNDDFKTKLIENKIINNSLRSNTLLFNYPGFLKYMDTCKIILSLRMWLQAVTGNLKGLKSSNYLIFYDLCILLFKIFIENEVRLHTLEIGFDSQYTKIYEIIFELILQNQNFIHNIKNLKFYAKDNSRTPNTLIKDRILQIINSHQNLKKVLFDYKNFHLYQSLLLSKDFNCSNTLNTIIFYHVDMSSLNFKIFERLNVLESIHIIWCTSLNDNFTQRIINLTKPIKLKTLFLSQVSQIESLQLLLQKSGCYLENFAFENKVDLDLSLKQQFSEIIVKYCKNIKYLEFGDFESRVTYDVFNLIENIKQYLNYLSISILEDGHLSNIITGSSMILQNLGQVLPSKLEYLSLLLNIKESDFKVFLENSQDIFINKLLIMQTGRDVILHYIKEFIMKEKRVKYLGIKGIYSKDLYYSKDEVKEFKLHNIKVQNICELQSSEYPYNLINVID